MRETHGRYIPSNPKHVQWETDPGTWRANLTHGQFVVGEMSCSRDRCTVWHCRVEKMAPGPQRCKNGTTTGLKISSR